MAAPADSDPAPEAPERVFAFCGACTHFEAWALGGGGDCERGHSAAERAAAGECPDRRVTARGSGPGFDMSE